MLGSWGTRGRVPCQGVGAGALEAGAQAQLELAGGLLGEGHRDDAIDARAAVGQHVDDAADELARLAGAGRRLDDHRLVEGVADAVAGGLID